LIATAAVVVLLVAGGVVLSRRADKNFALPAPALRAAPQAPAAPAERRPDPGLDAVLARGAISEKQSGPAAAVTIYRDALARTGAAEAREILLFALADVLNRSGDVEGALSAFDEIAASGSPSRGRALLAKADLLAAQKREPAAREIWEALASADGPERWKAKLRLGMDADREHDAIRALALYEEVIARAPDGPEVTAARLGAGALYRDEQRWGAARQMFEDVLRSVPPGSAEAASAKNGLASFEGK
jgi:tetratricopeptide (TPR) repeat protein